MCLNFNYIDCLLSEEELKRLREALGDESYGAVSFSYDQPSDGNNVGDGTIQGNLGNTVKLVSY